MREGAGRGARGTSCVGSAGPGRTASWRACSAPSGDFPLERRSCGRCGAALVAAAQRPVTGTQVGCGRRKARRPVAFGFISPARTRATWRFLLEKLPRRARVRRSLPQDTCTFGGVGVGVTDFFFFFRVKGRAQEPLTLLPAPGPQSRRWGQRPDVVRSALDRPVVCAAVPFQESKCCFSQVRSTRTQGDAWANNSFPFRLVVIVPRWLPDTPLKRVCVCVFSKYLCLLCWIGAHLLHLLVWSHLWRPVSVALYFRYIFGSNLVLPVLWLHGQLPSCPISDSDCVRWPVKKFKNTCLL